MGCTPFRFKNKDGTVTSGFMCGSFNAREQTAYNCQVCLKRRSTKLCDQVVGPESGKTCDRKLCDQCARKRFGEPEKDYCPDHVGNANGETLTTQAKEKTAAPECSESEILGILKQRPADGGS